MDLWVYIVDLWVYNIIVNSEGCCVYVCCVYVCCVYVCCVYVCCVYVCCVYVCSAVNQYVFKFEKPWTVIHFNIPVQL